MQQWDKLFLVPDCKVLLQFYHCKQLSHRMYTHYTSSPWRFILQSTFQSFDWQYLNSSPFHFARRWAMWHDSLHFSFATPARWQMSDCNQGLKTNKHTIQKKSLSCRFSGSGSLLADLKRKKLNKKIKLGRITNRNKKEMQHLGRKNWLPDWLWSESSEYSVSNSCTVTFNGIQSTQIYEYIDNN